MTMTNPKFYQIFPIGDFKFQKHTSAGLAALTLFSGREREGGAEAGWGAAFLWKIESYPLGGFKRALRGVFCRST